MNSGIKKIAVYLILISPVFAETIVLQNGLSGYTGCKDTYIDSLVTTPFGSSKIIRIAKGG